MAVSLVHEGIVFEDATVYVTGNAFFDCTFLRCTLVFRGFPIIASNCKFSSCIWHIDWLIHDHQQWNEFEETLIPMIAKSLPHAPDEKRPGAEEKSN